MKFKANNVFWLLCAIAASSPAVQAKSLTLTTSQFTHVQGIVKGRVLDAQGNAVAGATVQNLKSKKSVQSDEKGNFQIEAEMGDNLSISFIGYSRLVQAVTQSNGQIFSLQTDENTLEEVTISIGYQRIRKSDVTGAIASVKAEELNLSAPKLSQALVGKVAGVQVMQTSGAPYDGTKMRVRGMGSINAGSDPLYVIDGYPAGNNLNINPNDIESIDVLKDAASAAIYGSRGAGGVVLITTKRGKEGKSNVDYEVLGGFGQLSKKIDVLNSEQFIDLLIDGRNNS